VPACFPLRIAESGHVVVFKEHFNGLLTRLHPHTLQCYCLHSLKESHQPATSLCLNCAWWYIANSQEVQSFTPLCHSLNNFSAIMDCSRTFLRDYAFSANENFLKLHEHKFWLKLAQSPWPIRHVSHYCSVVLAALLS
jgi:hypothetical protein